MTIELKRALDVLMRQPPPPKRDQPTLAACIEALENSNSLLAAMLHETREAGEIMEQITQNRTAILGRPPRDGESF